MSPALRKQTLNSENPKSQPEHGETAKWQQFALFVRLRWGGAGSVKNWSLCARCAACGASSSVVWICEGLSFGMVVRMLPASRSSIDSLVKFAPYASSPLSGPLPFELYSFKVLSDFEMTTWSMAYLAFDSFQFSWAVSFFTSTYVQSVPATTTSVNTSQWLISCCWQTEW